MPNNLRQPDPDRFLATIEKLQDQNSGQAGLLLSMQKTAEKAKEEFNDSGISQESCAEMMELYEKLEKFMAKSYFKLGISKGTAAYFLQVGASEGSVPPCEC